jgi:hypothetical protein
MTKAATLVMQCAGQEYDIDTKLSDVFEDDQREQFCQCVAKGSGIARPRITCAAGSTFADVIESISC